MPTVVGQVTGYIPAPVGTKRPAIITVATAAGEAKFKAWGPVAEIGQQVEIDYYEKVASTPGYPPDKVCNAITVTAPAAPGSAAPTTQGSAPTGGGYQNRDGSIEKQVCLKEAGNIIVALITAKLIKPEEIGKWRDSLYQGGIGLLTHGTSYDPENDTE